MPTAPGNPTITLSPFAAPAFTASAVAMGATVAPVKLESTSPNAQTNVPFRFGQVFPSGDLAPADFLVGKIAGSADVPLQFNVLATHPNGSVRHAAISGVLPSLAAGATVTMSLARAASGVSTAAIATSQFGSNGFSAKALLSIGGVAYTADAAPAIAALAANKARIAGAKSTEYNAAIFPTTSGGAAHADLQVLFDATFFPDSGSFKVDVTFEHCRAFSTTPDLVYSGTIEVGGVTVYTLPNPLTHFPSARWMKSFWIGNPYPVVVRQDRDYLIDSKAVSNYDRRVTISEATLASYVTQINDSAFAPMGNGVFATYMPGPGGRPEIGPLPGYAANTVLSMDKRAVAMTLACGKIGGSWPVHVRDLGTGPGAGMPISCVNWPYITSPSSPGTNPATGQTEVLPDRTEPSASIRVSDDSHTPNFAYLPYLLTADKFYLEEMQMWTTGILAGWNYAERQNDKGIIQKTQVRGQAWTMRGIVENAAFCPDNHHLKTHFIHWVNNNIARYNERYVNNPGANVLGVLADIPNTPDLAYAINGGSGVGLFQDDFFTWMLRHAVELGFANALPMLQWKAKFQVGRLLTPGLCFQNAAFVKLRLTETYPATGIYTSLAECYAKTIGTEIDGYGFYTQAVHDLPCNSQARMDELNKQWTGQKKIQINEIIGHAQNTDGYPSNYQIGLAAAVDSGYPDGDLAWDLFESRSIKPDYGTNAQFAIVPRGETAIYEPDPVLPPTPQGLPKMITADRVRLTTTSTGTGNMTVSATPQARSLPLSSIPAGSVNVPLLIEDESGTDWEESYCTVLSATTFSRNTVIKSSNANAKVDFGAGAKTVLCTVPAEQLNSFLTPDSLDALSEPVPEYLAANPAGTPGGTDLLALARGASLLGVTVNALASAINNLWPGALESQVPVGTTGSFPLDFSQHNRRRLVCSAAPAAITGPTQFATVGNGFSCKISNLSGVDIPLTGITVRPSGSVIPVGASADVYAAGGSIYADLYAMVASSGAAAVAPGQVTGLTVGASTSTTQALSWSAPATGTAPFTYKIEKSSDGGATWTVAKAADNDTSETLTGLTAATSYKYRVSATNSISTGPVSAVVTASTAAAAPAGPTAAPFTVQAMGEGDSFECWSSLQSYAAAYWGQFITPTGTETIASVAGAIYESNTVVPDNTLVYTNPIGSRGKWIPAFKPYQGSYIAAPDGTSIGTIGLGYPHANPTNYYLWIIITDNTGKKWNFVYPATSFSDSNTNTKMVSHTSATWVP